MKKWEYRSGLFSQAPTEKELNPLGEAGWELVGFSITKVETGYTTMLAIFKRPKADPTNTK